MASGRIPEGLETAVEGVSTSRRRRDAGLAGRLCLVVIGEGMDATYPLPDKGTVGLGRAPDSDVRIDHRSVSRSHALLTIGDTLTIQDQGSSNGTRVRDQWLEPGQAVEITVGEPVDVGSVMVVVQQRAVRVLQRHIWAHGYFEARLEEECARAARTGGRFAVVRIHCGKREASRVVEHYLCRDLRAMDVIGYYGPAEHEVLIVDSEPDQVAEIIAKLAGTLREAGVDPQIGVAHYPGDARNPYELLARASAAALGEAPAVASGPVVIANAAMQNLDRIVQRIAAGTISVLITGETGVGKEVLAERLHSASPRADKPFLRLNCAALSESLLESELFGHEKGAFTGAVQTKAGLLETAEGGTIFLDEIGELPMTIQVKLLRVLEERQVLRVGALKPRSIDVRFLAATNRDLEAEIARGSFRQDLYFRLNGITLVIPPLRERVAEIPDLAAAFLRQAAERNNLASTPRIAPAAMALLCEYGWPGNIRELRNVIERAALLSSGGVIDVEHLPMEKMRAGYLATAVADAAEPLPPPPLPPPPPAPVRPTPPPFAAADADATGQMPAITEGDERQRILDALAEAAGNQTEAAKLLGISRRTLINRIIAYNIPRPRKK